jgi:predicted Holliday junction resolvase-like endonuclease
VPTNLLLLAAVVGAVIAIGWLLVKRAAYVAKYRYTEDDIESARKDSVKGSRSVVNGKIQEQLIPVFPEFFSQFNPRDARHLGSPIDFVIFDGLDDGPVERIVLLEVKTGTARLSDRERRVRDAVEAGHVEFQVLRLPSERLPHTDLGSGPLAA